MQFPKQFQPLFIIFASAFIILTLILIWAPVEAQDGAPAVIQIESPGLFPEGIEYDASRERFLVGSLGQGSIFEVADDGGLSLFVDDPDLISSVGIQIDNNTDRLLVVSSNTRLFMDSTLTPFAQLGAYDLESGERLFLVDLAELSDYAPNVANDVAVDAEGNAYVTDTFAPIIYRVDPDGEASIFWEDERFAGQGGPGLNGIEYHPDGFLLVPIMGQLYNVPVDDPASMTEVVLDQTIVGADGIILDTEGRLIVVSGQQGRVLALRSDDGWSTATVEAELATIPGSIATTAAIREEEIYILYAHLEAMMAGVFDHAEYEIVRLDFEKE